MYHVTMLMVRSFCSSILPCFVLFFCLFLSSASARELQVNPRSETAGVFKTINDALKNLTNNDIDPVINIAPGIYHEDLVITKSVTLIGSGPDATMIMPSADKDGITIKSSKVKIIALGVSGGNRCVYYENLSEGQIINNCVFSEATSHGITAPNNINGGINISNCVIANNGGSGVQFSTASGVGQSYTIKNCVIAFNGEYAIYGYFVGVNLSYCNIYQNFSGSFNFPGGGLTSKNINEDNPLFIDIDTGNYRVMKLSPLRDAGTPGLVFADPDGTRNDIGAFGGPDSANFFIPADGGPYIRMLRVTAGSVPQGKSIKIEAIGSVENSN